MESEKDIGVTIDTDLNFYEHFNEKINKANRLLGMIRRTFISLDEKIFKSLYKGIVRPHLEYGNPVWNPYRKKDINMIEAVQRRATKLVPTLKDLPYEERLKKLDLPTLKYRRARGDMIEVYKIVSGIYDPKVCEDLFQLNVDNRTRGSSKKLFKGRSRLNLRKYSFCSRVVDNWNGLREEIVSTESVKSFEARLDKW